MVGVVVRVGKANAGTDEAERHDGDGDHTFHALCSIVPMSRASAYARSLLAKETGHGRDPCPADVLVLDARNEGEEARGVGRTETAVPNVSEQDAVAAVAASQCAPRTVPAPWRT